MKPYPCPFCGEANLLMHPVVRETGTFVHCNKCGAEALECVWNFRINASLIRANHRLSTALQAIASCGDLKLARDIARQVVICDICGLPFRTTNTTGATCGGHVVGSASLAEPELIKVLQTLVDNANVETNDRQA